jgi:hypothetical protein
MAKKKDNTIIYIAGAAAILYFLYMRKKGTYKGDKAADTSYSADVTTKPRIIVDESKHAGFLQKGLSAKGQQIPVISESFEPIIGRNDFFKEQYKQTLNACSY